MFKYPLNVTIDTNIFDAAKFDLSDNSILSLLEKYVRSGKIRVVLSDIVVRESKRHIADRIKEVCKIVRKARGDAFKAYNGLFISNIGLNTLLDSTRDKEILIEKEEKNFDIFLNAINAEILGADLIDVGSILNDYFETNPPFEKSEKKKSEFPDAFIAQQIRRRFDETEKVVIVSNDSGLISACSKNENHTFFRTLGDLYDAINKEEAAAYAETKAIISKQQSCINATIREYIMTNENLKVHGLSYDKDGIESGYDYSDFALHGISEVTVFALSIDEISEKSSIATLSCMADISVDCYYEDYSNASWDSEEKDYISVDMKHMREEHSARFRCRIEIGREEKMLKLFPFTVTLGGDSRINRVEVKDHTLESDEEEIHDMDREELGFPQLRNYGEYLENDLLDSSFSKEIITKFKEVNNLYYKYDECHFSFESLLAELNTAKPNGLIKLIYESLSEISDIPHIVDVESITDSEIKDIRAWVHTQNKRASEIERMDPLPDEIVFGKAITIRGIDGSKVYFYIGNNQISPDEGSEEIIPIVLSNEEETIASGYIKLIVGYLKFDEDGGVVDGMEDDVNYEYQSILNKLDDFIQMQNCIANKDVHISEIINEAIAKLRNEEGGSISGKQESE